ncbi:LysR family transcriptional regulator [Kribbella sp. NPDC023972]|uniref:LysR family transcriptional regulator n=1 Tax=Kribbella sp. NPDC023972 TaxID=3154795 RepID=UPI0033DE8A71
MELRQLEIFVAVAEEEHVTRGAERMHVAQSAASATVRRLEREFGLELLRRVGRRVELTNAGRVLLDRAHAVLGEAQRTREQIALLAGPLRGHVSLAIPISYGSFALPAGLAAFRRAYPAVTLEIRQAMGPVEGRTDVLMHDEADLAIVPVSGMEPPQINLDRLSRLRAALVCRRDDELATRRGVPLADLRDRSFIDFPVDWGNRRTIDRLFAEAGESRKVGVEVPDIRTAQVLIEAGVGIGFLPEEAATERPRLSMVDLSDPTPWFEVALASRSDRPLSEPAAALRQVLVSLAAKPPTHT